MGIFTACQVCGSDWCDGPKSHDTEAELRGREKERADVVAWLKAEGFSCAAYDGVAEGRHVGAASKEKP